MRRKIILYELNEVPFRVLDGFCGKFPRSALATKLPLCREYETISEDTGHLSPWITWPSLHRGVINDLHQIHDLGQNLDNADRQYPPIWVSLAKSGVRVGVCGSLHSYPMPKDLANYAFYLPDTFALTPDSLPESLTSFQELNLRMVGDSGRNVSRAVPLRSALKVLLKAPALGVRLKTFAAIGGQIADEVFNRWHATRRRTFQSVLQFDVFMKLLVSARPDFATFFTNHVASAMHRYWAAAFPEDFQRNEYDEVWISKYRHEIEFAMQWANRFFEQLTRFVETHPEYVLWVATSMGQAAWLSVPLHSQLYVSDMDRFMRCLGVETGSWNLRRAMFPDLNVVVSSARADAFEQRLREIEIERTPLVFLRENEFFRLHFGHKNLHEGSQAVRIGQRTISFEELGLTCTKIEDKTDSSGNHVKNGMWLVYDPANEPDGKPSRPQVSTLQIAPEILQNYCLPVPDYMKPAMALP